MLSKSTKEKLVALILILAVMGGLSFFHLDGLAHDVAYLGMALLAAMGLEALGNKFAPVETAKVNVEVSKVVAPVEAVASKVVAPVEAVAEKVVAAVEKPVEAVVAEVKKVV
jgi:hypothetical protein